MSNFDINNYEIEKLYNHPVEKGNMEGGRFFQVVFLAEDKGFDIKLSPKIYMRIVFYPSKKDMESLENAFRLYETGDIDRIAVGKHGFLSQGLM
jgi:hypothetical protein